jgi:hypothetical protein
VPSSQATGAQSGCRFSVISNGAGSAVCLEELVDDDQRRVAGDQHDQRFTAVAFPLMNGG